MILVVLEVTVCVISEVGVAAVMYERKVEVDFRVVVTPLGVEVERRVVVSSRVITDDTVFGVEVAVEIWEIMRVEY